MWQANVVVEKWSEEACEFARNRLHLPDDAEVMSWQLQKLGVAPEDMAEVTSNLLLNAGIQRMEDNLIAVPAATAVYDNTHARLGVGNSSTAEAATQTDLQAAAGGANRQFKLMNATFPSRSSQTLSFASDFTSGEANFVWNEWGIDNGTSNGTTVSAPMLNRKVASLGTKATGTWTLTATLTIS
jgi:hypothetical protein